MNYIPENRTRVHPNYTNFRTVKVCRHFGLEIFLPIHRSHWHGYRTHLEEVSAAGVLLEDGDHVGVVQERGRARSVVVHAARFVGQVTQRRTGVKTINFINQMVKEDLMNNLFPTLYHL